MSYFIESTPTGPSKFYDLYKKGLEKAEEADMEVTSIKKRKDLVGWDLGPIDPGGMSFGSWSTSVDPETDLDKLTWEAVEIPPPTIGLQYNQNRLQLVYTFVLDDVYQAFSGEVKTPPFWETLFSPSALFPISSLASVSEIPKYASKLASHFQMAMASFYGKNCVVGVDVETYDLEGGQVLDIICDLNFETEYFSRLKAVDPDEYDAMDMYTQFVETSAFKTFMLTHRLMLGHAIQYKICSSMVNLAEFYIKLSLMDMVKTAWGEFQVLSPLEVTLTKSGSDLVAIMLGVKDSPYSLLNQGCLNSVC